jgi:hypothetical protein
MKKLRKTKKTLFLPSIQDDQLQSDYGMGKAEIQCNFNLVDGGAITTDR